MISIIKATGKEFKILADIGKQTFIESHGKSAPQKDIDSYAAEKFSYSALENELKNSENIYHIIYYENEPVGYSKIIINFPHPNIELKNITKLERLYLLTKFHKLNLGTKLFEFNVALSKNLGQSGMWLFVWKENPRAINFYLKHNFRIIGSYHFPISATHTNPNHQMFVQY